MESVGDTLLKQDTLETLPNRPMEICTDLHLDPYYGEEEETEALHFSKAKPGTTALHAYATLYVRVRNKPYTLAVRQLIANKTNGDVLGESIELLYGLDIAPRPSTVTVGSTTAPVSPCCTPTTTTRLF